MGFTKNRAKLELIIRRLLEPRVTYTVCTAPGPLVTDEVCTGPAVAGVVVETASCFAGEIFGVQYARYRLVAIFASAVFFPHLELTQLLKYVTATDCLSVRQKHQFGDPEFIGMSQLRVSPILSYQPPAP